MITNLEKNQRLHENYTKYFERFNDSFKNGYQLEAFLIIIAMHEIVTKNMIIRIASINNENHAFMKENIEKGAFYNRIECLKKYFNSNKTELNEILKKNGSREEILDALNEVNKYRNFRNDVYHDLLMQNFNYDELKEINEKLLEDYKVLNKNQKRIIRYIKKNNNDSNVDDIVDLLWRKNEYSL